jgi:uncharacterized protein
MIDRVGEFCALLRKNGVRVSTSEVLDASRALDAVGPGEVGRVRAALRASLIKREADLAAFDELFGLYFLRGAALARAASEATAAADAAADPALLEALAREAAALGPVARAGLGLGAPQVAQMIAEAGAAIDLGAMRTPLQVGFFGYRLLEQLGIDRAEAEATALLDRLRARRLVDDAGREAMGARTAEGFERLRRAVRAHVEAEFRRRNLDFAHKLAVRALSDKPLARLSEREMAELRREVERLARVLRERVSLRPKVRRRGRLDLRRTLRRSLATGGVPFEIKRRERERRKPRLVILCDISDSVRNVSRFLLQFVYAVHELFDRVHSFGFVADLGELTELFERHQLERALERAYGGEVFNVFASSNYGRALEQFTRRHLDKVTSRTTVIVIGDGRTNYHPARVDLLSAIAGRARQLWWLNPESPASWGFGDSAMPEYEPVCDRVVVARDLESLRTVVDSLVM